MSAKIISILNMKGGVGKTTLSCNISLELANRNNKVLVIDADPQFNTTQTLFQYYYNDVKKYNELEEANKTLRSMFIDNTPRGMDALNKEESIIHSFEDSYEVKGLDLIPGDLRLIIDISTQSLDKLKSFFNNKNLREKYDYIIIDLPPTWSQLTNIFLDISNYYIIPTKLDEFSTIGITLLDQLIGEKASANPGQLMCLGVVYMMLNPTDAMNGISTKQRPYKSTIEDYFKKMSRNVQSNVSNFDTVFYYTQPISTESAIYRNHIKRYPELQERVSDLVDEIISRIAKGDDLYE